MRYRLYWLTLLGLGLLALPALAQPPEKEGDPPADPAMKQKLLDAFDTNKDGKIDQAERQAMRRAMWENFGPGGPGGPEGRRPFEERRRGDDGRPGDRRPEAREEHPRPPRPERLFERFDENKDSQLSLDEFKKLTDFVHEHFPPPPPPPPREAREGDRRGHDGPRHGEFDRHRPGGPERRPWSREERPPRPDDPPPGPDDPSPPEDAPDSPI